MKKSVQLFSIALLSVMSTKNIQAQVINDSVSIQAGYTNQTFYSMPNGMLSTVSNTDWDLGFQLRGFAASILINSKNNVHLYRSNKDAIQWSTMTAADTTGILNSAYELFNSDESWDWGAFNNTNDSTNQFDLGWGVYDPASHHIIGDSLYFIQLPNGDYKKLWIESLQSGTYYFRHADLDGSNETLDTLFKSHFMSKYFGYFSISNHVEIDREPVYNSWDLVFTQYLALTPSIYKVSGVLSNDSVNVAKAYPVDVNGVNANSFPYNYAINTIGYNWKTYDFGTNSYIIEDSLIYFVEARNHSVWKMIFTGFGGGANGNYYFNKELVGVAGVTEQIAPQILSAYPNPTSSVIQLVINNNSNSTIQHYQILNMLGKVVLDNPINLNSGLNSLTVSTNDLSNGIYFLRVGGNENYSTHKILVQH